MLPRNLFRRSGGLLLAIFVLLRGNLAGPEVPSDPADPMLPLFLPPDFGQVSQDHLPARR